MRIYFIDSLLFITSTPSYRREKLDLMISQLSIYRVNLSKYKRLVAQKNSALKRRCEDDVFHQIHCLMAPLIIQIVKERQFLFDSYQQYCMVTLSTYRLLMVI